MAHGERTTGRIISSATISLIMAFATLAHAASPTTNPASAPATTGNAPVVVPGRWRTVEVSIGVDGTVNIRDDRTNKAIPTTRPSDKPYKVVVGGVPNAFLSELPNHDTSLMYDFPSMQGLGDFSEECAAQLDPETGALLTIVPHQQPANVTGYESLKDSIGSPRLAHLPLTLRITFEDADSRDLRMLFWITANKDARPTMFINFDGIQTKGDGRVLARFWPNASDWGTSREVINRPALRNVESRTSFKVPLAAGIAKARTFIQIEALRNPITIRRIELVTASIAGRLNARLRERLGEVTIDTVMEGPAMQADLRPGDVVLKIGNTPINTSDALMTTTLANPPGTMLPIRIRRDGVESTVNLTLE